MRVYHNGLAGAARPALCCCAALVAAVWRLRKASARLGGVYSLSRAIMRGASAAIKLIIRGGTSAWRALRACASACVLTSTAAFVSSTGSMLSLARSTCAHQITVNMAITARFCNLNAPEAAASSSRDSLHLVIVNGNNGSIKRKSIASETAIKA